MSVCQTYELSAPSILISTPKLSQDGFENTVILLLEHGEAGSMGVVLNRASDVKMSQLCLSQGLKLPSVGDSEVYIGGPLHRDRAFILHTEAQLGEETEEVFTGIFLSYTQKTLRKMLVRLPQSYRIFLGYAGWAPDQLAAELVAGAWIMGELDHSLMFANHDDGTPLLRKDVWRSSLSKAGIDSDRLVLAEGIH